MKPLELMDNVQKARLLHGLMANEVPGFLTYMAEVAQTIYDEQEAMRKNWKDQLLAFDFWFDLARGTGELIEKHREELTNVRKVFSEVLFGGYMCVFAIHCLHNYVGTGRYADPKMEHAVNLLFT
ncbi:hypothetical protein BDD43_1103 [Mucilaginibacter gracilis]|uniref:Uncharacterized protein n=2 Tax=Mucilaginibacter TaxID=423349 RepID=H1YGZ1_9SPHI|nr:MULTISPECIES: hypothetical protein [Mucilaginibacter]EHQ27400.1 hypothetical protein Mucpa_3296 [Mucilaginibacter paludis DSM 18603]RKR80964.1 hypothetical protein BDD43_1103 [Mucilaginibacter gracilis]